MDPKQGHKKRLRKRYMKDGLKGFHDYEVLEIILSYSLIRKDTKLLAKKLIEKFGGLTEVLNKSVSSLKSIKGIGERTAVLIKLFRDVPAYYMQDNLQDRKISLNSPDEVYDFLDCNYRGSDVEEFVVIYLNTANEVIDINTLFSGTIDRSAIYIRELVKEIIELKSSAVILAHNHPSGNLSPSIQDKQITKKIKRALQHIDVNLLDHIIYGDSDFFSFKENNVL